MSETLQSEKLSQRSQIPHSVKESLNKIAIANLKSGSGLLSTDFSRSQLTDEQKASGIQSFLANAKQALPTATLRFTTSLINRFSDFREIRGLTSKLPQGVQTALAKISPEKLRQLTDSETFYADLLSNTSDGFNSKVVGEQFETKIISCLTSVADKKFTLVRGDQAKMLNMLVQFGGFSSSENALAMIRNLKSNDLPKQAKAEEKLRLISDLLSQKTNEMVIMAREAPELVESMASGISESYFHSSDTKSTGASLITKTLIRGLSAPLGLATVLSANASLGLAGFSTFNQISGVNPVAQAVNQEVKTRIDAAIKEGKISSDELETEGGQATLARLTSKITASVLTERGKSDSNYQEYTKTVQGKIFKGILDIAGVGRMNFKDGTLGNLTQVQEFISKQQSDLAKLPESDNQIQAKLQKVLDGINNVEIQQKIKAEMKSPKTALAFLTNLASQSVSQAVSMPIQSVITGSLVQGFTHKDSIDVLSQLYNVQPTDNIIDVAKKATVDSVWNNFNFALTIQRDFQMIGQGINKLFSVQSASAAEAPKSQPITQQSIQKQIELAVEKGEKSISINGTKINLVGSGNGAAVDAVKSSEYIVGNLSQFNLQLRPDSNTSKGDADVLVPKPKTEDTIGTSYSFGKVEVGKSSTTFDPNNPLANLGKGKIGTTAEGASTAQSTLFRSVPQTSAEKPNNYFGRSILGNTRMNADASQGGLYDASGGSLEGVNKLLNLVSSVSNDTASSLKTIAQFAQSGKTPTTDQMLQLSKMKPIQGLNGSQLFKIMQTNPQMAQSLMKANSNNSIQILNLENTQKNSVGLLGLLKGSINFNMSNQSKATIVIDGKVYLSDGTSVNLADVYAQQVANSVPEARQNMEKGSLVTKGADGKVIINLGGMMNMGSLDSKQNTFITLPGGAKVELQIDNDAVAHKINTGSDKNSIISALPAVDSVTVGTFIVDGKSTVLTAGQLRNMMNDTSGRVLQELAYKANPELAQSLQIEGKSNPEFASKLKTFAGISKYVFAADQSNKNVSTGVRSEAAGRFGLSILLNDRISAGDKQSLVDAVVNFKELDPADPKFSSPENNFLRATKLQLEQQGAITKEGKVNLAAIQSTDFDSTKRFEEILKSNTRNALNVAAESYRHGENSIPGGYIDAVIDAKTDAQLAKAVGDLQRQLGSNIDLNKQISNIARQKNPDLLSALTQYEQLTGQSSSSETKHSSSIGFKILGLKLEGTTSDNYKADSGGLSESGKARMFSELNAAEKVTLRNWAVGLFGINILKGDGNLNSELTVQAIMLLSKVSGLKPPILIAQASSESISTQRVGGVLLDRQVDYNIPESAKAGMATDINIAKLYAKYQSQGFPPEQAIQLAFKDSSSITVVGGETKYSVSINGKKFDGLSTQQYRDFVNQYNQIRDNATQIQADINTAVTSGRLKPDQMITNLQETSSLLAQGGKTVDISNSNDPAIVELKKAYGDVAVQGYLDKIKLAKETFSPSRFKNEQLIKNGVTITGAQLQRAGSPLGVSSVVGKNGGLEATIFTVTADQKLVVSQADSIALAKHNESGAPLPDNFTVYDPECKNDGVMVNGKLVWIARTESGSVSAVQNTGTIESTAGAKVLEKKDVSVGVSVQLPKPEPEKPREPEPKQPAKAAKSGEPTAPRPASTAPGEKPPEASMAKPTVSNDVPSPVKPSAPPGSEVPDLKVTPTAPPVASPTVLTAPPSTPGITPTPTVDLKVTPAGFSVETPTPSSIAPPVDLSVVKQAAEGAKAATQATQQVAETAAKAGGLPLSVDPSAPMTDLPL